MKLRQRKAHHGSKTESHGDLLDGLNVKIPQSSPSERSNSKTSALVSTPRSPHFDLLETNTFRAAENQGLEEFLLFQEKPRQIFFLGVIVCVLSYYSFTRDSNDFADNIRHGMSAAIFIFLTYCFLQTRDGLLVRPHPGVWRIVHGCAVVYALLLGSLCVQNVHTARAALKVLFPEVGTAKKGAYKLECEITRASLYQGVTSIWFLAHVTGWWGKMCMFRDWRFCWVLSIGFELVELAFQFAIPDFQECWWDSVFMDTLGANIIGMGLGQLTLNYLETKEYDWSGKQGEKTGYVRRLMSQFTPITWSQYHWEVFSSFKRFGMVCFALAGCLLVELNAFFLMNTLSIPKDSRLNSYRLTLVFLIGIPGTAEYYEYVTNPKCTRFGQNSWMLLSIIMLEAVVWLRFSIDGELFQEPPPAKVAVPIAAFFALFGLWMILFFGFLPVPARQPTTSKWGVRDILFWVSFLPLLYLTQQWAF